MTIDSARAILAETGTLRAVINLGNPILAWGTEGGDLDGPSVRLAREISQCLDVDLHLRHVEHARDSFRLVRDGEVDLGFLAIDPLREKDLAFSQPYITIEGGFLVRSDSPLRTAGDVDQVAIGIAASRGSAYGLYLQRVIATATIVETATFDESVSLLASGSVDVAAGLLRAFSSLPEGNGLRVLDGDTIRIEQAICIARHKADALRFLNQHLANRTPGQPAASPLARDS